MEEIKKNHNLLSDLFGLIKLHKLWFLLPIIISLIIVGALIFFVESGILTPFIYVLL